MKLVAQLGLTLAICGQAAAVLAQSTKIIDITSGSVIKPTQDPPPVTLTGPLANLAKQREGRAMHEGSWDRSGGNGDMRYVKPGETLTLLDHKGAGIIHRFWVTIAPRSDMEIHRQAILRMYWDGETSPSVECPIGDFFGVGFGEQKDYISLPLNETSGGYNCYWSMPFHKSARWTLTNLSKKPIDAWYYNIDFTAYKSIPEDQLHFHAQWRRENPTKKDVNYTILDTVGRGHFVGAALFMQNRRGKGLGFLEGDEMIYLDGEAKPSIIGTGTEDYFSSGWYYDRGVYSAPYHGVNILDAKTGRVSTYRWHVEDAMPFEKSIKVTIEHGTNNDHEGDYSSVAFYYQTPGHPAHPPLPANPSDLLPFIPPPPFKIAGAIELEGLLSTAKATSGPISVQEMDVFAGGYSGDAQLWWRPAEAGAELTLKMLAPEDGEFDLIGYFTKAPDYGIITISVNGVAIGGEVNLYDGAVVPSGAVSIGKVKVVKGENVVAVKVVRKDDKSKGYLVGLDAFVLKK